MLVEEDFESVSPLICEEEIVAFHQGSVKMLEYEGRKTVVLFTKVDWFCGDKDLPFCVDIHDASVLKALRKLARYSGDGSDEK